MELEHYFPFKKFTIFFSFFVNDKINPGHPFIFFEKKIVFASPLTKNFSAKFNDHDLQFLFENITCDRKNKVFFHVKIALLPLQRKIGVASAACNLIYLYFRENNIATFHALLVIQMHCYKS